jgi:hypothetical protein
MASPSLSLPSPSRAAPSVRPQSLRRCLCPQPTLLVRRARPTRALPTAKSAIGGEEEEEQREAKEPAQSRHLVRARTAETSAVASSPNGLEQEASDDNSMPPVYLAFATLLLAASSSSSPASPLAVAAALAAESAADATSGGVAYDPSGGEGLVKTVSGALYVGLVSFFLWRVLGRRARRARQERIAGQAPVETPFTRLLQSLRDKRDEMRAGERAQGKPGQAGPADALLGAAQAGLFAVGLWLFTTKVELAIAGSDLPDGFTARNMAVTVRTILLGLLYLITFIFSANCAGLFALSVQMVVAPGSILDDEQEAAEAAERRRRREEARGGLPRVSVRSSPDELKAAFAAAAGVSRKEEGAEQQQQQQQQQVAAAAATLSSKEDE